MSEPAPAGEINLRDYWQATRQQWRVWVGVGLIAATSTGLWSYCIRPTEYLSSASIIAAGELAPSLPQATGIIANLPIDLSLKTGSEAELCGYILQTRATRRAVVRECNLRQLLAPNSIEEASRRLGGRTKIQLERPNIVRLQVALPGRPRGAELITKGTRQEAAERAARTVNSYISALRKQLSQLQLTAAKRKRIFLDEQKQKAQTELNTTEQELQQWEAEHKIVELDSAGKLAVQRLMGLQEEQEKARVELCVVRDYASSLRDKLKEQPEIEPASVVHRANPLVDEIREKLVALESKIAVARDVEGKSAQHPEVRKLQRELDAAHQALVREQQRGMLKASSTEIANPVAKKLQEELALEEATITATEARIEGLGKALRRTEQQMAHLSAEMLEYSRLARNAKIKQEIFETLATEYERALIEEQGDEPVFRVIDGPVAPEYPTRPNVVSDVGLAGAIGVLVGWVWIMAGGLGRKREESSGEGNG